MDVRAAGLAFFEIEEGGGGGEGEGAGEESEEGEGGGTHVVLTRCRKVVYRQVGDFVFMNEQDETT